MKNTIEDFKAHVDNCEDESQIDWVCITWLKLCCMDHGSDGERASALLNIVEDMLCI